MTGWCGQFPSTSLLARLPAASREALLELGTARKFAAGKILVQEGDLTSHVLVLLDGRVKVTATTPDGHVCLLAVRGGGDLIGELAAMDGSPRIATVTTAGPVMARLVTQADFRRFLTQHADVAFAVTGSVGAKLRSATRRWIDFDTREVRVRLARTLVELATNHGIPDGGRIKIDIALTQPELAALVGAAEPTVHRALAKLRGEKIVDTGYRRVFVCDRDQLAVVAEG